MIQPIILIPGFTGSRLKTQFDANDAYETWINTGAINGGLDPAVDSGYHASQQWIEQMKLASDGMTPLQAPAFNHSFDGLGAISDLAPSEPSVQGRYFYALIERLRGVGYSEANMVAAPYDWRLPPAGLELRFQYFTRLKKTVESLHTSQRQRVALLGHSLGNRIVQYFLQWVQNNDPAGGKQWIDDHIAQFFAVSALWLGVPKSLHEGLVDLGHLGIMTISGVKPLYQSYGALPWMLPVTNDQYKYLNTEHFAFLENDSNPLSEMEAWALGSADDLLRFRHHYYEADPNYTSPGQEMGSEAVELPYVESLNVLHGSGQDTEVGAYYKTSDGNTLVLYEDATSSNSNFRVESGVRLEIDGLTTQFIDGTKSSGDGFLPYGSLMYYTKWKQNQPSRQIQGFNYHGCTHYDVLENEAFLNQVVALLDA